MVSIINMSFIKHLLSEHRLVLMRCSINLSARADGSEGRSLPQRRPGNRSSRPPFLSVPQTFASAPSPPKKGKEEGSVKIMCPSSNKSMAHPLGPMHSHFLWLKLDLLDTNFIFNPWLGRQKATDPLQKAREKGVPLPSFWGGGHHSVVFFCTCQNTRTVTLYDSCKGDFPQSVS